MLAPFRGKHADGEAARLKRRPRVSGFSTTKNVGNRSHACPATPVQAWHSTVCDFGS
jgi:hypothetical protein